MLQKIYINTPAIKVAVFIEIKNFKFDKKLIFDEFFDPVQMNDELFENCKNLIMHNQHFPEVTTADYGNYDLELGDMIKTPDFLL